MLLFVVPKLLFVKTELMALVTKERSSLRTLRSANIFDDLPDAAFSAFAQIVRGVEYRHNTIILRQGERASRFCILVKGICRTLRYSDYGRSSCPKRWRWSSSSCSSRSTFRRTTPTCRTTRRLRRAEEAKARH